MFRYTLNGLTLLSAALCVAVCVLWVRSWYAADVVAWRGDSDGGREVRNLTVRTARGGFQVEDYRLTYLRPRTDADFMDWLRERRGFFLSRRVQPEMLPSWTIVRSEKTDLVLGYPYGWPDLREPSVWDAPRLRVHRERRVDRKYDNRWRGLVVPYWLPALAFATPPAAWLLTRGRRALSRRRRTRRGLCPACGYDLTGNSSGICPECGTPAATRGKP